MKALTSQQQKWVDQTLAELTLREKIGQMLLPCITDGTADPLTVQEMVEKYGIAGGHVFRGSLNSRMALTRSVQSVAKIPLLLTADFEAGVGDAIAECTRFPAEMAFGAVGDGDEDLAYQFGKAIAVEGLAAGINWNFGPLVDLAVLPNYQRQISTFGRDPQLVARLAVATIAGMQDNGMAATAKHFPGDGFDDRDQHLTTTVNTLSRDEWMSRSAVPFKAAIAAGVYSIMNSGFGLPSVDNSTGDPQRPMPSMLSPILTEGLLRKELGFEGVIVTDAINMGCASQLFPEMERYLRAIEAGNDGLLFVRRVDETVETIEAAIRSGRLTEERITASARRMLEMKARMNLHERPHWTPSVEARKAIADLNAPAIADEVAEKSVTLLADSRNIVPLKVARGTRVASILITNQPKFTLELFDNELRAAGCTVTSIKDPSTDEIHDRVLKGEFDVIITSLFFPVQYAWNTTRIHGPFSRCVMSGYHIANPNVKPIFISFSNPNHLYELPHMDPYLVTYGATPSNQRAAARAVLGQSPISGRIPMSLEGFFEAGDGIQRPASGK